MAKSKRPRAQRREAQRLAQKADKQVVRQHQQLVFSPPPLSGDRLKALVDAGLGRVVGEGQMVIDNTEEAWELDPWLWLTGTVPAVGGHAPFAVFVCKDYQVSLFDVTHPGFGWPKMWHLSIKRRDREPLDENRWRILQQIKNSLVGTENEAVELYPAESRLVDTANQMHLWVFADPEERWPFGFTSRYVTDNPGGGAVQRSFDDGIGTFTPEDEAKFRQDADTEMSKIALGDTTK